MPLLHFAVNTGSCCTNGYLSEAAAVDGFVGLLSLVDMSERSSRLRGRIDRTQIDTRDRKECRLQ